MSLARRATRASAWVVTGYGASQVLRLGSNLIMTRLLVPEVFGLMAIVNAIFFGLAMMSDFGIRGSIVYHKRGEDSTFLRTAWSLQIIRGMVIWGLALLAAGLLFLLLSKGLVPTGTIYADPLMPQVIMVSTFASVLMGFESTNLHLASRNLALGRLSALEVAGQAVAIPVMILWALQDASVWALVAGGLTSSLVRSVGSHFFIPGPRCRLGWDPASFWEMFHFGKWILLSSTMGFVAQQGDKLLLGAFLTPRQLGLYAIASLLADALGQLFSKIFGSVGFPALSEAARESRARLRNVYYRIRSVSDVALFSAAGLLLVLGDDLVRFLYDDRYHDAGWMLQILSLTLFLQAYNLQGAVFTALGDSRSIATLTAVRSFLLPITLVLAYKYFGIVGAVLSASVRFAWALPLAFWMFKKLVLLDSKKEVRLLPLFAVGVAAGLAFQQLLEY